MQLRSVVVTPLSRSEVITADFNGCDLLQITFICTHPQSVRRCRSMGGVGSSRSGVGFRVASREAGSITSNSDGFDIQAMSPGSSQSLGNSVADFR